MAGAAKREHAGLGSAPSDAPLAGVVVIQDGAARSVRFAGRLLTSYGATVIQVPPLVSGGGDPDEITSATRSYLDSGKLSVAFDRTGEAGITLLARLRDKSDIVVRFLDPAEASQPLAGQSGTGPILIDISWFGRAGPWSGFLCDDFLAQHVCGMAFTSALRVEEIATSGPRAVPGHLAEMVAGLTAATAAAAALSARGADEPAEHIDISVAESIVSFMRYETVIYSYGWGLPSRSKLARSPVAAPVFQQATRDGFVDMLIMQEAPWRALLEILGNPAWGDDELFATHPLRSQYWDALEPLLQAELSKASTTTLVAEGQQRGVAIAPVNSIAQAAAAPQFAERGFFTRLLTEQGELSAPGRPFQLGESIDVRAAPRPGQDNVAVLRDWLGCSTAELTAAGATL